MGGQVVTMGIPSDRHIREQMEPSSSMFHIALSGREGMGRRSPDVSFSVPFSDICVSSSVPSQSIFAKVTGSASVSSAANPPMVASSAMETASQHVSVCTTVTVPSISGPVVSAHWDHLVSDPSALNLRMLCLERKDC